MQVATIWNEVLVQQAADGHNAAALQRLVNFDLRHTTANSAVNKPMPDSVSQQQLPGVSAAAAVYNNSSGPPPGELCLGSFWQLAAVQASSKQPAASMACQGDAGLLAWLAGRHGTWLELCRSLLERAQQSINPTCVEGVVSFGGCVEACSCLLTCSSASAPV